MGPPPTKIDVVLCHSWNSFSDSRIPFKGTRFMFNSFVSIDVIVILMCVQYVKKNKNGVYYGNWMCVYDGRLAQCARRALKDAACDASDPGQWRLHSNDHTRCGRQASSPFLARRDPRKWLARPLRSITAVRWIVSCNVRIVLPVFLTAPLCVPFVL